MAPKTPHLTAKAGGVSSASPVSRFEVWANDIDVFARRDAGVASPPALVILFGNEQENHFEAYEVIDNRTWFVVGTYAEAQDELWEDEYTLVAGRMPREQLD